MLEFNSNKEYLAWKKEQVNKVVDTTGISKEDIIVEPVKEEVVEDLIPDNTEIIEDITPDDTEVVKDLTPAQKAKITREANKLKKELENKGE